MAGFTKNIDNGKIHNNKNNSLNNMLSDISNTNKNILIATQTITDNILFNNGLFQNILFFYDLFDIMGYKPYLVFNTPKENTAILNGYRIILPEDIIKKPMPVHLYIEVGMSIDKIFCAYLKEIGSKTVRLYLGHILNIDTETCIKTPQLNFPHHTQSHFDEVWVSPHYSGHLQYACAINKVGLGKGRIAPYVWMPKFITVKNRLWNSSAPHDIIISEPNISFQKCGLLPLILAEAYANAHPEWTGRVKLMNSERLRANCHFQINILGKSAIRERIDLLGRQTIHELMTNNPGGVFIGHHWNNEYNYMTMELVCAGWPVLHNSHIWKEFGYYWTHTDINTAIETLYMIMCNHSDKVNEYKSKGEALAWNYNINNADVQTRWRLLLED